MKKITTKRAQRTGDEGAVFMELTIILPFLCLILIGVSDLGLFLQSYFRATHVVREGLRTAVAIPELEASANPLIPFSGQYLITNAVNPVVSQSAGITNNHAQLQERIRKLLQVDNSGTSHSMQLTNDEVQVDTNCVAATVVGQPASVTVTVNATYAPLLPLQDFLGTGAQFKYKVSATGNYLFTACS